MKITPEAVKERIAALESAGELSLKEQFYLEALRLLVAAMDSEPDCKERKLFCSTDTTRMRKTISVSAGTEDAPLYRHAQQPVVSADLLHTAASAIEDLLTTKDRTGAGVWFDLPFRLRSAANAQPAPVVPDELKETVADFLTVLDEYPERLVPLNRDSAVVRALRAAMLPENPVCTCPSGDGSLRWPCPVHPGNSPAIPEGYKLVPTELTSEMVKAFRSFCEAYDVDLIAGYKAMLAAAPQEVK